MEGISGSQRFAEFIDNHKGKLIAIGVVALAAALFFGARPIIANFEAIKAACFQVAIPIAGMAAILYVAEKGGGGTLSEIKNFGKQALPGVTIAAGLGLGVWYFLPR